MARNRVNAEATLAAISGLFVLASGIILVAFGLWRDAPELRPYFFGPGWLFLWGLGGVCAGSLAILAGLMLRLKPRLRRVWGALIIVFVAGGNVFTLGAFSLGFSSLFGIAAGYLAITKPLSSESTTGDAVGS